MRSVTVVVPIHNERENIRPLYDALAPILDLLGRPYEVVLVDDGSTDGTKDELARLTRIDERVKVIEFRGNFGQTAAISAGIREARGDVIVTLDGDLQNDPADIPEMLARIDAGADVVHGWRKERQDRLWSRRLPSMIANRLIARVTGFPFRDLGCTLRAMRREVAQELPLYGEMHRFISVLAAWRGARCEEMVVRHHPRRFGQSKYGLSRTLRVLLDLVTVKYLIRYLDSPMKLFGGIGFACFAIGGFAGIATIAMKLGGLSDMTGNPLLLLTVFSGMVGVQFLVLGMLGELGARIYYDSPDRTPYAIRRRVNFDRPSREVLPMEERRVA